MTFLTLLQQVIKTKALKIKEKRLQPMNKCSSKDKNRSSDSDDENKKRTIDEDDNSKNKYK